MFLQPPRNGNDSKPRFSPDPESKGVRYLKGAKSAVTVGVRFRISGNRARGAVTSRILTPEPEPCGELAEGSAWEREPRRQSRIWPPRKLGSQDQPRGDSLLRPAGPAWPHREGRGWEGHSPCREKSSKGARGEPRQVIPGPRGARPPPARLLVATAEARAGLSALLGQPELPRLAPWPQSARNRQRVI